MILTRTMPGHWWVDEVTPDIVCATTLRGYYACVADPFASFTQTSPGVWVRNVQGLLPSELLDGVTAQAGMRVFAWSPGMATSLTANNGPYVFDDPGSSTTFARIHRDPSADESSDFFAGMNIAVTGGDAYAGTTFRLATGQPITLGTTPLVFVQGAAGGGVGPAWLTDAEIDVSRMPSGSLSLTFQADLVVPIGATARVEIRTGGAAETPGDVVAARATQEGPFVGTMVGASVAGVAQSTDPILLHLSASTTDSTKAIEVKGFSLTVGG